MSIELPAWCRLVRADNPTPMTLEGTNTYFVIGTQATIVIDPGPQLEGHLAAVAGLARPVTTTVITHHHLDHVGGAARFHELTAAPVRAHDPALCIDGAPLRDGEVIDLGGVRVEVVDTPGHTADSVCLMARDDAGTRALLSGDTVLGAGSTIIAHPDGALGPYLASLRRLRGLLASGDLLLPGHGPARPDASTVVDSYLTHREQRLDQVRAALAAGATTPREVVEIVYADVDPALWPAAEASTRAQLDYLAGSDT